MLAELRRWCTNIKTALVERLLLAVDWCRWACISYELPLPLPHEFQRDFVLNSFIYIYIHVIANLHMTTTCFFLIYNYKRKNKQCTLTTLLHSLSFILEQHQVLC